MKLKELIKGDKKRGIGIYILLLAGVVLLSLSSISKDNDGGGEAKEIPAPAASSDYISELEERLESILSAIDGAGQVEVMLVAQNSGSAQVEKDISDGDSKTVVVSKQGSSEALIVAQNTPSVRGAIIVARGAGNDKVKADLAEAASAALGVGIHRVKVYKRANQ